MKKNLMKLMLALTPAMLMVSCGGGDNESSNTDVSGDTTEVMDDMDDMMDESGDVEAHLPDATSIMYMFNESGLKYIPNATSDNAKAADYVTKDKQMLNFGVFVTDMVYSAQSGKFDEAKEDLKVAQDLAGKFGLESIFASEGFMERIDNNMENKDSMFAVMGELYVKGQDFMQEEGMKLENFVLFTGSWVEAVYLGTQDYLENNNTNLEESLSDQMLILNALITGLSSQDLDAELKSVVEGLVELKNAYEGLESVKAASASRQVPDLTEEEVAELSTIVVKLRNQIVK